jgi:hypothetical protein
MPSDPQVFDELKLPFIFVPHGVAESSEWLARHPDHIKLPASFVPRPRGGDRAQASSAGRPSGRRALAGDVAAPPDPISPLPPAGNAMPDAMPAGTTETLDRGLTSDGAIAAFLRVSDALATAAHGDASGCDTGSSAPTGYAR